MLKELLIHEIKNLLRSKRVIWSISIFIVLFFIIFSIRFQDFKIRQQNTIVNQDIIVKSEDMEKNYSMLKTSAVHPPVLFSIYHEGSFVRSGHVIDNSIFEQLDYTEAGYSEPDRYFKDNIKMDITILITFFLSLFVLLNTFDSINFEKQAGTLRLLTTFPVKRTEYLAGKIIGMFLFVTVVLGLPYLLSFIVLVITFPSLISVSFILQYLLYFLFAELFIVVFILLGTLCSLLTHSMRKSLAYVLLIWLMSVLILPILTGIVSEPFLRLAKINKKSQNIQAQIYDNYKKISNFDEKYPAEKAPWNGPHMIWNGWVLNNLRLFVIEPMAVRHSEYLYNYYKGPFQLIRKNEQLRLEREKNDNWYPRNEYLINFFNPVTQFSSIAENISGSSDEEYWTFLKEGIRLRDKLIDQGVNEKWLFNKSYYAIVDTSYQFTDDTIFTSMQQVNDLVSKRHFQFKRPFYEKYQNNEINFGSMIKRTLNQFIILLFMIIVLSAISVNQIKKYDVR